MKDYIVTLPDAYFNNFIRQNPELIRCKDCIYFTSGEHWNICRFCNVQKTADGYCDEAERKEK